MTKSLFDHLDLLVQAHPAAKDIDVAKAPFGLPPHPGAERYYREIGLVKYWSLPISLDRTVTPTCRRRVRAERGARKAASMPVRASRRALRALLSMRYVVDGNKKIPHPEETAEQSSRRTHDADPGSFLRGLHILRRQPSTRLCPEALAGNGQGLARL